MPRLSRRGRVTLIVLAAVLVAFALIGTAVDIWTDRLWFGEVHFTNVFTTILWTKVIMFLVFGVAMGLLVAGNLYLAFKLRPFLRPHSAEQSALDHYRLAVLPRIGLWIGLTAGLMGLFTGLAAKGHWQDWLLFRNSQPFNVTDSQFHTDLSFYVFEYPFWRYLLSVAFVAVVLALVGSMLMHYLFGGVRLQGNGDRMTTAARLHLSILVAVFAALKAVAYALDKRGLLFSHNSGTGLYGAGYRDVNALLPAKDILMWISIITAVALIASATPWVRSFNWLPGLAVGLLVLSAVVIGGVYPMAVQTFSVKPNIRDKEAVYRQRSIDATREAYGLSTIKTSSYPGNTRVPVQELTSDKDVVPHIRLLDPAVVSDTYAQLQQTRGFYDFGRKLDVDRYTLNGETQDYVVGVREINYDRLTAQQSNWQNAHTVYTHGYGFVAAPANTTVCNGQPYFVSGAFTTPGKAPTTTPKPTDCPGPVELLKPDQPRIYYGERMSEYAITGEPSGAPNAEFDRPSGEASDQYFTYDGSGGVAVGSYWRRILYAYKFKETNFLISNIFNQNSRVLYNREPRARLQKIAPFLTVDGDPYPAIVDGKVLWIMDAYTTSAYYPYSQKLNFQSAASDALTGAGTFAQARQDITYIRNSVKATVDAYTGEVNLYQVDDNDPIVNAWNKVFGGKLLKPSSAISPDLRAHFRYPEDMFKVQRDLIGKFHVTGTKDYFSGQDFWDVPTDPTNQNTDLPQPPYFLYTKLGDQAGPQFQLAAALRPLSRENLASLVSGYYGDNGPQIQVLELPKDTQISGPEQAQTVMTTDPVVRQALTLLSTDKSQVVYGNLLSLPFSGGMLYVEPIYLRPVSGGGTYTTLRKVLLSYGNTVAFEDNLGAALQSLVKKGGSSAPGTGEQPTPPPTNPSDNAAVNAAVAKIQLAIQHLQAAQQKGDFVAIGNALAELDAATKEFNSLTNGTTATPTPTPVPS
jgi:uncharacterized membrane protein (UPF0182 family)